MTQKQLKSKIIDAISIQGFSVNGHVAPRGTSKLKFKKIQSFGKKEQLILHRNFIEQSTDTARGYFLNGKDLDPSRIDLELREVTSNSIEEVLFKWWNLAWWSMPYQKAYGRQMRFIIWDKYHDAPFGLIGLQSPVLKMAVRDNHLNFPRADLDIWVNKSMHAQRLGALPPYNLLIGGKMVALTLTANELRQAYENKYEDAVTVLQERVLEPELLYLTTTSAYGRSSIYNRLNFQGEQAAISLGYTQGSGTFHIGDELYKDIVSFLRKKGENVETTFGNGPSRKLKLLYIAFNHLKLPNYSYHNIKREFFLFPTVSNLSDVIQGAANPIYYDRPFDELSNYWLNRWGIPRSERTEDWKKYQSRYLIRTLNNILKNA